MAEITETKETTPDGETKVVKTVHKESAMKGVKRTLTWIFITVILVVTAVGGSLGYAYRHDVRDEMCKHSFTKFIVDKAFQITDCSDINVNEDNNDTYQINTSDDTSPITAESVDVAAIYEKANPSVVGVGVVSTTGITDSTQDVIGSGFVISSDGLIATNQHVVSDTTVSYFIKFPGEDEIVNVDTIYRDTVNDVAILKINRTNLPSLTLGSSDQLKPGDPVIAIGNPLGDLSSSVTSGIVSGLHRTVSVGSSSFFSSTSNSYEDTIQTDAAINPGNSGGPLLNSSGNVIGINFATIEGADNLSFALPIEYLKTRVEELNQYGRFRIPYIGIQYNSQLVNFGNKIYSGAKVVSLAENSSAKGILEVGDIIIEIDGQALDESSLSGIIQKETIGAKVEIDVIRNNKIVTELVEIIERE